MTITSTRFVIKNKYSRSLEIGMLLIGACLLLLSPSISKARLNSILGTNQIRRVVIFDGPINHPHAKNVLRLVKTYSQKCSNCAYELFSIYDEDGNLDLSKFTKELKNIENDVAIVHLSWNMPMNKSLEPIKNELIKISQKGILIVAAAGEVQDQGLMGQAIETTIMGQIPKAILIGELDSKHKLPIKAYYGTSILTALRPPKPFQGSSFTAPLFTGRLMERLNQYSPQDLFSMLQNKKQQSKNQWPRLEELLP